MTSEVDGLLDAKTSELKLCRYHAPLLTPVDGSIGYNTTVPSA